MELARSLLVAQVRVTALRWLDVVKTAQLRDCDRDDRVEETGRAYGELRGGGENGGVGVCCESGGGSTRQSMTRPATAKARQRAF